MKRNIIIGIVLVIAVFGVWSFASLRSSSQTMASLVAFIEEPQDEEEFIEEENEETELSILDNITINRDDDGNVEVIATEKDINDAIQEILLRDERLQTFVRTASVQIFDGYFEFKANTEKPLKGNVFVRARALVKNGRLIPEIMKVKYGMFSIPTKLIISMINGATKTQSPNEWIQTPDITWKSVAFTKGKIVIRFQEEELEWEDNEE